jgi:hypothetical protein
MVRGVLGFSRSIHASLFEAARTAATPGATSVPVKAEWVVVVLRR